MWTCITQYIFIHTMPEQKRNFAWRQWTTPHHRQLVSQKQNKQTQNFYKTTEHNLCGDKPIWNTKQQYRVCVKIQYTTENKTTDSLCRDNKSTEQKTTDGLCADKKQNKKTKNSLCKDKDFYLTYYWITPARNTLNN